MVEEFPFTGANPINTLNLVNTRTKVYPLTKGSFSRSELVTNTFLQPEARHQDNNESTSH